MCEACAVFRPVRFLSLCMSLILLVKRIRFVDILLVKPNFRDAQGYYDGSDYAFRRWKNSHITAEAITKFF